jgi:DNA-binding MarR family transcriptional regulator
VEPAEQLYVALQHAAHRLRAIDAEVGLSPARFSVLVTLRYDGSQPVGELARIEGVAQPTMSQVVDGLEAAGWVERRRDPADARRCVVAITSAGRAKVRRARARKIAWVRDALGGLDDPALAAVQAVARSLDERARPS